MHYSQTEKKTGVTSRYCNVRVLFLKNCYQDVNGTRERRKPFLKVEDERVHNFIFYGSLLLCVTIKCVSVYLFLYILRSYL